MTSSGLSYKSMATTPEVKPHQGGMTTVGHHVCLPLGWMDGHTWYQLATILN
jgi:hypothetical protein